MWKDIERISGVPFSRSSSPPGRNNTSTTEVRLQSLRIALDKQNEVITCMQTELNTTKIALLDATSRANDSENTIRLLKVAIDKLRCENDLQRNELLQFADKDTKLEQLDCQIKELRNQLSRLNTSNKALTSEHSQTLKDLETTRQQTLVQTTEIKRLDLRLTEAMKREAVDKETAQVELKQATMLLQTKLEHAQQQLMDSEAREKQAQDAKREATDALPKLLTKFQSERDLIRSELTKLHKVEIETYTSHLKEMDSRLAKQAEEFGNERFDAEGKLIKSNQALETAQLELDEKRSQCEMLQEEIVQLNEEVTHVRGKLQSLQKEKSSESQASQSLIDRLQRQVKETRDLLEKERNTHAASLTMLEHNIIATVRDNFSDVAGRG